MKEFKINLSKGEVLYTGSYICTLSKTVASTPEQISLETAAEKLAEELIMQQAMNREHQRQQEVTVIQFRQAQKDIKLLQAENKRYRNALEFYANETTYTNEFEDCPPAVELDRGQTARKALEGAAE
ncbi:hypothetical protein KUV96_10375 [Bacillus velezensis]|uniref:hypothetical protein n=1 Tax=Bacillus amyloliquefaciens group TaxID=1938374 RepID=UPI000C844ED5|nr:MULTISPECIES: hypothetical protein [Bacillus amyloliquefaciens group]MBY6040626.1 hypothetical protein [Bacillus velezensis]MCA1237409.1 hypothetical protein [Bacillus velezensis]